MNNRTACVDIRSVTAVYLIAYLLVLLQVLITQDPPMPAEDALGDVHCRPIEGNTDMVSLGRMFSDYLAEILMSFCAQAASFPHPCLYLLSYLPLALYTDRTRLFSHSH